MTRFLPTQSLARVYDRIGVLQDTQAFYEDPALEVLLRFGSFEQASSIYEAGCGTGRVARRLMRYTLPATCTYLGVDVSERMVRIAATRTERWSKVRIQRADITECGPLTHVDRVLSLFVIDLMDDARIALFLKHAYRALKPGGLLCIAGLAEGVEGFERFISSLWKRIHDVAPEVVGGCRPGSVARHLDVQRWRILHAERLRTYGICSEAVVAERRW